MLNRLLLPVTIVVCALVENLKCEEIANLTKYLDKKVGGIIQEKGKQPQFSWVINGCDNFSADEALESITCLKQIAVDTYHSFWAVRDLASQVHFENLTKANVNYFAAGLLMAEIYKNHENLSSQKDELSNLAQQQLIYLIEQNISGQGDRKNFMNTMNLSERVSDAWIWLTSTGVADTAVYALDKCKIKQPVGIQDYKEMGLVSAAQSKDPGALAYKLSINKNLPLEDKERKKIINNIKISFQCDYGYMFKPLLTYVKERGIKLTLDELDGLVRHKMWHLGRNSNGRDLVELLQYAKNSTQIDLNQALSDTSDTSDTSEVSETSETILTLCANGLWRLQTQIGNAFIVESDEDFDNSTADIIKALTDGSLGIDVNAHLGTEGHVLFQALFNPVSRYRTFRELVKCKDIDLLATVTKLNKKNSETYHVGSTVLMQLAKSSFEEVQDNHHTISRIDDPAQEAWKEFLAALDERYSEQEVLDYLNQKDELGNSAFLYAASLGKLDLCEELIRRGVDPEQKNNDGQNAFMLFTSGPIERGSGFIPFYCDEIFFYPDKSRIEYNGQYNNAGDQGRSIVKYFVQQMFNFLLEHDPECYKVVDNKHRNALMTFNELTLAELLLTHETFGSYFLGQVNAQDDEGKTALMRLSNSSEHFPIYARYRLILLLLKNGANVDIADNTGKKALDYWIGDDNERYRQSSSSRKEKPKLGDKIKDLLETQLPHDVYVNEWEKQDEAFREYIWDPAQQQSRSRWH